MRMGLIAAVSMWTAGGVLLTVHPALGQVNLPQGFEIVEFGFSEKQTSIPGLNGCGQIVYHTGGFTQPTTEAYLYDNGRIVQLTNNNVPDVLPDINDAGTIVWTHDYKGLGRGGTITMLRNGKLTELGTGSGAEINNRDHVAWKYLWGVTCRAESDIYLYKRRRPRLIFADGLSNQGARLNDRDQIVWKRARHCAQPWWSDIMLYADLRVRVISPDPGNPNNQYVDQHINNPGVVAWMLEETIFLWEDGDVREFIVDARSPSLNNLGDMFFRRWVDGYPQIWVYLQSTGERGFFLIADDRVHNLLGHMNDFAEVAWRWSIDLREGPDGGIRFMRRVRTGDSEFDEDIDLVDYGAFADCMTGPGRVDRLCDCRFLDIDHDGDVDLADFARFQNAFTGS